MDFASDRYELGEQLGEGGVASVWRARDRELGRDVAIKILHDRHASSSKMFERFAREARVLAGLSHPNVVAIYDVGSIGERPHIVMELVRGRSLREALTGRPMRGLQAATLMRKVALGVAAAHARGVVHRDLKPANILLTAEGEPKVGDFGLAYVAEGGALTRSGTIVGTPLYMAPEQIRGDAKGVGPATDVYALGVILYEALTGCVPHKAETLPEIYQKVLLEEPRHPREFASTVDADLEAVVLKALDKAVEGRYRDASELAEDLRRYIVGEAVCASRTGTLRRLVRKVRSRPGITVPLLALIAAVGGGIGWVAWSGARRSERAASAIRQAAAHETAGRLNEALSSYAVALELDPVASAARGGHDRVKARLDENARAARYFEDARPALDRAEVLYFRESFDFGDLERQVDAAAGTIEQGLALAPCSGLGHYLRGRAFELRGDSAHAEAELGRAIEFDGTLGAARLLLARIHVESVLTLTTPGLGTPREMAMLIPAARARARTAGEMVASAMAGGTGLDARIDAAAAEAIRAFVDGTPEAVVRIAGNAVSKFARTPGMELLHVLASRSVPPAEADAHLVRALEVRPQYAIAHFLRGLRLSGARRDADAVKHFRRSIEIRPSLTLGWAFAGASTVRLGRHEEGEALLRHALELEPHSLLALVHLGVARTSGGDPVGGLTWLDRALVLDDRCAAAWYARGQALQAQGEWAAARDAFSKAFEIEPTDAEAVGNRAVAALRLGEVAAAIPDLERAIALDRTKFQPYANLAAARLMRRELDEARRICDRGIEAVPDCAELLALRAELRHHAADYDGSEKDADRAISIDPSVAEGWFWRGAMKLRRGDREGARSDLEQALKRSPADAPVRGQARALLDRLDAPKE